MILPVTMRIFWGCAVGMIVGVLAACSDDTSSVPVSSCSPGATTDCQCTDGSPGKSVCSTQGSPGVCSCGTGGTSGAGGQSGSAGTGGTSGTSGSAGVGGAAGTGGTAGSGGASGASGAGGTGATGGSAGSGGNAGSGGAAGVGGAGGTGPTGPGIQWARTFGSTADDVGAGINVDVDGNTYVVGAFSGLMDVGNNITLNAVDSDAYIVKLDPSGNTIWAKSYGGPGFDVLGAVKSLPDGSIYVSGVISSPIDFGGGAVPHVGGLDGVMVHLDANGQHLWSKSFGSVDDDTLRSIDVHADGSATFLGVSNNTWTLDGVDHTAAGTKMVSITAAPDGVLVAANEVIRGGVTLLNAVRGPGGDYWVVGDFNTSTMLGTESLPWVDGDDNNVYVARMKADGTIVWARGIRSDDLDFSAGIDVRPDGTVVVPVVFAGTALDAGAGPVAAVGFYDMGLTSFDANGTLLWSKVFGSSLPDGLMGGALAGDGSFYAHGVFSDGIPLGSTPVSVNAFSNACVVKFSSTGEPLWWVDLGAAKTNTQTLYGDIALDPTSGAPVTTWWFQGSHDYGAGMLASKGGMDVFVAKLLP